MKRLLLLSALGGTIGAVAGCIFFGQSIAFAVVGFVAGVAVVAGVATIVDAFALRDMA